MIILQRFICFLCVCVVGIILLISLYAYSFHLSIHPSSFSNVFFWCDARWTFCVACNWNFNNKKEKKTAQNQPHRCFSSLHQVMLYFAICIGSSSYINSQFQMRRFIRKHNDETMWELFKCTMATHPQRFQSSREDTIPKCKWNE